MLLEAVQLKANIILSLYTSQTKRETSTRTRQRNYKTNITDNCHMRGFFSFFFLKKLKNERQRDRSLENPESFRKFNPRGLTSPTALSATTR